MKMPFGEGIFAGKGRLQGNKNSNQRSKITFHMLDGEEKIIKCRRPG